MDIGKNIYISIMCGQLFKIIRKHGVKCQFGSTPGVGCQDSTFTTNTLLHIRHNHNLPTWAQFAYLVKAFDTSNHALLIAILGKYGAPPRLFSAIKHMYYKSIVKLIIVKVETYIDFKVGVKQEDSMALVLYLFLMMAFSETLEYKWKDLRLSKPQFARKENSPRSTGELVIHRTVTFSSGTLSDLFFVIYVDDSTFVSESRTDTKRGISGLSDHSAHFGHKIHIGAEKNPLKTQCVFFPPPGFFHTQTLLLPYLTNSNLAL